MAIRISNSQAISLTGLLRCFATTESLSAQMEEAITVNPMSTLLTNMTKTNIEIWKEMQENLLKSMENPSPSKKSKK